MRTFITFGLVLILATSATAADLAQLPALIKQVQSDDVGVRFTALDELETLGLDAAPALPEIIAALDDADKSVRDRAVQALGAIGPEAAPATAKLIEMLGEGKIQRVGTDVGGMLDMCERAAMALGKMGPPTVGPLMQALAHRKTVVRYHAAWALHDIGPEAKAAVPALIRLTRDRDTLMRMMAIQAVARLDADAKIAVPVVLKCVDDRQSAVRAYAMDTLGQLRPLGPEAVKGLIRGLGDKEGRVQWHAAQALVALGPAAAAAVPALCEALKSREGYGFPDYHPYGSRPVAAAAAETLGRLGPRAKSAMPALLAAARDTKFTYDEYGFPKESDELRSAAVLAAARIDSNDKELLGIVEDSLRKNDTGSGPVFAFAQLGTRAKTLLPLILERMERAEGRERLLLACAAVHVDSENRKAIDAIVDSLNRDMALDKDGWQLLRSALMLSGAYGRHAIPALTEMLVKSGGDKAEVAATLAAFGPAALSAVPALVDMLADLSDEYRHAAVEALRRITEGKPDCLGGLIDNHGPVIRCGITEVLGSSTESVELLVRMLADPSARVRLAAVNALGRLGKPARKAVPDLKSLLNDERPTVRQAAAKALKELKK